MNVIRRVFELLWRGLDGLRKVLHLIVLLFLFALVLAAFRERVPIVPAQAALVIAPQGALVEELSGDAFDRAVGEITGDREPEALVPDIVEAIRAAAKDDRIDALVLETEDLTGGGLAKLRAIARAIEEFRAAGKKVYAHGEYVTQTQYYLMAQADEAYLEPQGAVGVDGFSVYSPFLKGGLDKLGVSVSVFRSGAYKSLGEPFTRTDMSPEVKAETQEWLGALWLAYAEGVAQPRGLEPAGVNRYVEQAVPLLRETNGDAALMAEKARLVTGRKTRQEFEARVAEVVGPDEDERAFAAIDQDSYLAAVRSERVLERHPAGHVAVVTATGEILDGSGSPGTIGADTLSAVLENVRHDDDVKAVVLRIDSPGGSVLASELIRQRVAALREAGKPVVASFSTVAASGGYYIATAADEIWAEPTTITGSIGVIAIVPTFEGLLGKLGVGFDGVATSKLAEAARLDRELSPEIRELLQLGVDQQYRHFLQLVAESRGKTVEQADELAQGRTWLGTRAKEVGLVDELGGLDEAVKAAARLAKLQEGQYGIDRREQPMSWREVLIRDLGAIALHAARRIGLVDRTPPLASRTLAAVERELGRIAALNDPRNLYFLCTACEVR